jgi:hypothetical protein
LLGVDAVDAEPLTDRRGDAVPVTRDERDVADAGGAKLRYELGRVGADPVADQGDAGEVAVDGDQDPGSATVETRRQPRVDAVAPEPRLAADQDAVVVDHTAHALAEALLDLLGNRKRQVALLGAGDERPCERVGPSTPTSRRSNEFRTDQLSGTSSRAVVAAHSPAAGRCRSRPASTRPEATAIRAISATSRRLLRRIHATRLGARTSVRCVFRLTILVVRRAARRALRSPPHPGRGVLPNPQPAHGGNSTGRGPRSPPAAVHPLLTAASFGATAYVSGPEGTGP